MSNNTQEFTTIVRLDLEKIGKLEIELRNAIKHLSRQISEAADGIA